LTGTSKANKQYHFSSFSFKRSFYCTHLKLFKMCWQNVDVIWKVQKRPKFGPLNTDISGTRYEKFVLNTICFISFASLIQLKHLFWYLKTFFSKSTFATKANFTIFPHFTKSVIKKFANQIWSVSKLSWSPQMLYPHQNNKIPFVPDVYLSKKRPYISQTKIFKFCL